MTKVPRNFDNYGEKNQKKIMVLVKRLLKILTTSLSKDNKNSIQMILLLIKMI